MAARLRISERTVGDVTILDLAGRFLVSDGDPTFCQRIDALVRAGAVRLVVNLQGVLAMDSAGVGVLVAKYLSVRRAGGDLRLLRLSDRATHVLGIAHLLTIFEVFDSEESAVASFAGLASEAEATKGSSVQTPAQVPATPPKITI